MVSFEVIHGFHDASWGLIIVVLRSKGMSSFEYLFSVTVTEVIDLSSLILRSVTVTEGIDLIRGQASFGCLMKQILLLDLMGSDSAS